MHSVQLFLALSSMPIVPVEATTEEAGSLMGSGPEKSEVPGLFQPKKLIHNYARHNKTTTTEAHSNMSQEISLKKNQVQKHTSECFELHDLEIVDLSPRVQALVVHPGYVVVGVSAGHTIH